MQNSEIVEDCQVTLPWWSQSLRVLIRHIIRLNISQSQGLRLSWVRQITHSLTR